MDKLKVVWICNFSNIQVRNKIPLSKMRFNNLIRKLIGKQKHQYNDIAAWVTTLITEFEKIDDVELHVISPFVGLKYLFYRFELNGIFYYFYQPNLPFVHIKFTNILFFNKLFVTWQVKRIQPDIINLIGTENPYYSATVLGIKNIPIYVSVQTVYTNPQRKQKGINCLKFNWDIELKIHKKENYYGCSGTLHRDLILNNKKNAIIFKMFFPFSMPSNELNTNKIYDFVFFSDLKKYKGIEDLIDAMVLVKKKKANVTLNVIGKCSRKYKDYLTKKIKGLELNNNVIFSDFFKTQEELHHQVKKSRIAVFPVIMDIIPTALLEAIMLGLPVAAYRTTGTPYLNKEGKCVLLCDIGDIKNLAENMTEFMNNPEYAYHISQKARIFVEKEFNSNIISKQLIDNYYAVINHYRKRIPIPQELLFNKDEFI